MGSMHRRTCPCSVVPLLEPREAEISTSGTKVPKPRSKHSHVFFEMRAGQTGAKRDPSLTPDSRLQSSTTSSSILTQTSQGGNERTSP
jgi:hypothetical protein